MLVADEEEELPEPVHRKSAAVECGRMGGRVAVKKSNGLSSCVVPSNGRRMRIELSHN